MKTLAKIALMLLGFLLGPALAQPSLQPSLPAGQIATPSLWHIKGDPLKGDKGEVYLFGSVHVLPPHLEWRTAPIRRGLSRSDVYVFEVPQDEKAVTELQGLIQAKGYLPQDQSLRGLLHREARPDFDAVVADSGLPLAAVDHDRPWLAGIQLMFAQMAKLHFGREDGVEAVLADMAVQDHKQTRYLETIAEQFALLAPDKGDLELEEFEAGLKDLRDVSSELEPMVKAWSKGNQAELDRLINGDLDQFPEARKELLDDRNARWVPKIEAMLKEKHIFFITVGAGHLTGPKGVPALLRKAGYKVEGP
ncbi:MAG TPA: TraB/GumN family protein [Rhizomicrobium sp.]|nr:TraB/GumN family protein [Rhizomicrobium sp.]